MAEIGRVLVLVALALLVVGVALVVLGRLGFRGLPWDIRYEGERFGFYFPIVMCLVVSLVLTVGVWLWQWLRGR